MLALFSLSTATADPSTSPHDAGESLWTSVGVWPRAEAATTDGRQVMFVGDRGDGSEIVLLDPLTGSASTIETIQGEPPRDLRMGPDAFVYVRGEMNRAVLKWRPLDGGTPSSVASSTGTQTQPTLLDDTVAWVELGDEGPGELYLARLGEPTSAQRLTNDAYDQNQPVLGEGHLVWVDGRDTLSPLLLPPAAPPTAHPRDLNLYFYDRTTGATGQLTSEIWEQESPTITGTQVVYISRERSPERDQELMMRDLTLGLAVPARTIDATAQHPNLPTAFGRRAAYLQGLGSEVTLRTWDLDRDTVVGDMPGFSGILSLEARRGIAVLGFTTAEGGLAVEAVRLPATMRLRITQRLPDHDGERCVSGILEDAPTADSPELRAYGNRNASTPWPLTKRGDSSWEFQGCAPPDARLRASTASETTNAVALEITPTETPSPSRSTPATAFLLVGLILAAWATARPFERQKFY